MKCGPEKKLDFPLPLRPTWYNHGGLLSAVMWRGKATGCTHDNIHARRERINNDLVSVALEALDGEFLSVDTMAVLDLIQTAKTEKDAL